MDATTRMARLKWSWPEYNGSRTYERWNNIKDKWAHTEDEEGYR